MYLLNLRVQSYLPGNMTHLGIYMALCFIGALILGLEKIFWIYKYGRDAMFDLGKLWGIKMKVCFG